VLPLESGALALGRAELIEAGVDDLSVSRVHAQIFYDGWRWVVRDEGSRNGTFVDGRRISEHVMESPPVIRLGHLIALAVADARGLTGARMGLDGAQIAGAAWRAMREEIAQLASFGATLHLRGESGAGKELAARHFHEAGSRAAGPFVAVNCAAIPEGVAERLLFGAVRGAYSGADASADGYVQAADQGTLFLDEVAELDLNVQAKLLRVIETRQVTALGAARARAVDLRVCSATHRDLRAAVAEGRFREDLYFRLGRPEVRVPPLRERREEIPFHAARTLAALAATRGRQLGAEATFIEALLLRHWPGNVRELLGEVSQAALRALIAGRSELLSSDLASKAGREIARDPPAAARGAKPTAAEIEAVLRAHQGNVSAAARALKVHRTQLRRWLKDAADPPAAAQARKGDRE
jgi:transcriptional regulator with PAS, ATPase and Fis domain